MLVSCAPADPFVGKWETRGAAMQALELDSNGSAHLYIRMYGSMMPLLMTYSKANANTIALNGPGALTLQLQSDGSLKQIDVTKKNDSWALMGLRTDCPAGITCPETPLSPVVLVRVQNFDFSSGN